MELDDLQHNWDELGRLDPLWAILADPDRHGNRWSPEEFFATGREEVRGYLDTVAGLGLSLRSDRALDFGCGAGRLTQALSQTFTRVVGVDIAPSMTELAVRENALRNRHPERVAYVTNASTDLRGFETGSFDLVLSIVVLQHMSNDLKESYLRDFLRVLRPGGVAVFTVPSHADWSPTGMVRRLPNRVQNLYRRRRYGYGAVMEFHPLHRRKVEACVTESGGRVVASLDDPMAGPPWTSYLYVVEKPVA